MAPESYLGDKLKLKKQTKSPSVKGVKNKVSPKTRKRTAAMISDSEDEVVIRISKRRKHMVARSRLDVSDSPESETNDLSDSIDGDREARNLKGLVKSKVKKDVYSFDSKSSSTDFEIKTFKSRKRKMSNDSNKSGSWSASLCSTPVKSVDETLVQSTSSSESGDTPVKGPRKKRKSLESLVKSRRKKKVSNRIEEENSDSEQDSDTPAKLETSKTKKFGKRKIETKKEREHFETDESDTPVDSEDETLSKLRQNRSKISKNLKLKPTVVKTDSSGESDEEITAKPTKFSKNAKGTKGKKDSFNKTENRKTSKQSSSDSSSGSEMSEDDDKISASSKSKKRVGPLTNEEESDSGLDSDNSEDVPLAKLNTSCDKQKTKVKKAIETNTSKDKNKIKGTQSKTLKKKSKPSGNEPPRVKNLRKIVRACGIVEWNDHVLKDCHTDKQKIERLKQMLKEAGMKGRPSLKKAENIKLKKEAAELDSQNIISAESSRGKRKVNSRYSKRKATPSPKKPLPRTPVKKQFSGLMGIIDSEGSD